MASILVLNGPNLQLLGTRETNVYGDTTLAAIETAMQAVAAELDVELDFRQSNHEGELVDWIGAGQGTVDGIIINPAAYTHTSVAIRDALLGVNKPTIEVHLSNIYKREEFRKKSLISDVVLGIIAGFGKESYFLAFNAAIAFLKDKSSETK